MPREPFCSNRLPFLTKTRLPVWDDAKVNLALENVNARHLYADFVTNLDYAFGASPDQTFQSLIVLVKIVLQRRDMDESLYEAFR